MVFVWVYPSIKRGPADWDIVLMASYTAYVLLFVLSDYNRPKGSIAIAINLFSFAHLNIRYRKICITYRRRNG
jgi:hypothetical protein